ncbi:MAG: hypothetical protein F4Z43_06325 [Rhodothermaceae bacterium]|nr:hypothetical protein [Rhodothermaceae bacterium]
MSKQVHDFSAVLLQLNNDAGIIIEITFLESTIGEYARLSQGHHVHFGLPVRNLRESIGGSFMEIGESWWKRLSADLRLKGNSNLSWELVKLTSRLIHVCPEKKPLKRCLSSSSVRVFGFKWASQLVEGRDPLSLEPVF